MTFRDRVLEFRVLHGLGFGSRLRIEGRLGTSELRA